MSPLCDCTGHLFAYRGILVAEDRQRLRELVMSRRTANPPCTQAHAPFRMRVVVTYPC